MKAGLDLVIPDACVLSKWVLEEADSPLALKLQMDLEIEQISMSVPDHCFTEILNTLGRKWPDSALQFFSYLHMTRIVQCRSTLETVSLSLKLMKKYPKITFYDASYHALAIHEKGIFVTVDERYFKTTRKEGCITLLEDYVRLN